MVRICARCSFPWFSTWATSAPALISYSSSGSTAWIVRSTSKSSDSNSTQCAALSSFHRESSPRSSICSALGRSPEAPERRQRYPVSASTMCWSVARMVPYVPSVVASSCSRFSPAQNSSSSCVAHELWRSGSMSPEVMPARLAEVGAGVDVEGVAGDGLRQVAGEEEDHLGDLLARGHVPERGAGGLGRVELLRRHAAFPRLLGEPPLERRAPDGAGEAGERPRRGEQGTLARGVGGLLLVGLAGGERVHHHDGAAAAFGHGGCDGAGHLERADEVCLEGLPPHVERHVRHLAHPAVPERVVHEDVDAAERLDGRASQRGAVVLLADV